MLLKFRKKGGYEKAQCNIACRKPRNMMMHGPGKSEQWSKKKGTEKKGREAAMRKEQI